VPHKDENLLKNLIRYVYQRRRFFFYFSILLVILSYAVFGRKGILQRVELELQNRGLVQKLIYEKQRTTVLQNEIELLKTSDKKIEKVAREKYGMVKEGEEIYKVVIDSTK
jgi:cell division protein FtsB